MNEDGVERDDLKNSWLNYLHIDLTNMNHITHQLSVLFRKQSIYHR